MPARRKTDGGELNFMRFFKPKSPIDLQGKEQLFVNYVNRNINREDLYDGGFSYNKSDNTVSNITAFKKLKRTYPFPEFVKYAVKELRINTNAFLQAPEAIPPSPQSSDTPSLPSDQGLSSIPSQEVTTSSINNNLKFFKNLEYANERYLYNTRFILDILFKDIDRSKELIIKSEDYDKIVPPKTSTETQGGAKKKSLDKYTLPELKEKAKKRGIKVSGLTKKEIIEKLRKK